MTFPILPANGPSGYNLTRSLRFRSSASAYLSRTPATSGSLTTWTWSGWVKRGALGTIQPLFGYIGATQHYIRFLADNTLDIALYDGASYLARLVTTQVFRDPSAYYHIVVIWNTTNATASNRVQLYINGVQVTAFSTATYPAQNTTGNINSNAYSHGIGSYPTLLTNYFDGYLAEVNFIDGQALTPSSFGSTNTLTGVWQPARYTGTYGTNGFYLPFTDNSGATATTIGKDFSGNGNNWTPNNISITAGVTYDSMTDVPTLTSATAANFAVLNPLFNSTPTLSAGNLNVATNNASASVTPATIGVSSGKWYWEITATSANNNFGIISLTDKASMTFVGQTSTSFSYYGPNGNKYTNAAAVSYGSSYTTNDVIGVALDMDSGTLAFYKNNTSQGTAFTGLSGTYFPATGNDGVVNSAVFNFGQRPFAYTPPTGFVALNTYNLPTSTIVKGNTVMDATLWTGNGSSSQTITNAGTFKPDLVWMKTRNQAYGHLLFDSIRGTSLYLQSNSTGADTSDSTMLSSFNSNGFTVGSSGFTNGSGNTEVGWQWQAGQGTTSSNTSGTITSTVSVNASAGFSVVTYTGTGANATVGHGLGVAPSMVIVKIRSTLADWRVYHASTGATNVLYLNATNASTASSTDWNNTAPTSSVFSIGTSGGVNNSGSTYVAYCWTPIAGYSAFGSYTGNGSSDGTFVYTGFRPAYVMIKGTNVVSDWVIKDYQRANNYNPQTGNLYADLSLAEDTTASVYVDLLSNGFKLRGTYNGTNGSGYNYIYMAFAETPTKFALAR